MRLCMISGIERRSGGGLENVVYELSKYLSKHGVEVTILYKSNRDSVEVYQNNNSARVRYEGIRSYDILPPRLRFALYDAYAYSLRAWKKVRSLGPFDIIHGHGDYCFFPSLLRSKTPLVMNIHGVKRASYSRTYGPNSRMLKSPRSFPMYLPEKIAAKRCDLLIACSKNEADDLKASYGIDPAKIRIIYNGVDAVRFRPTDKRLAKETLGLPENKNYAIWVGNNPGLKGLSIAIKAVKDFENLDLLVAGVARANFENVVFWGNVPNQMMHELYNAADFLVFPTLVEGFPLVPLEAMACGLPIIISKECPTLEIIKEGVHGFIVDEMNPECYAQKMKTLLSDRAQYQEMSRQCRKLAEKFAWENQAREYLKMYQRIL